MPIIDLWTPACQFGLRFPAGLEGGHRPADILPCNAGINAVSRPKQPRNDRQILWRRPISKHVWPDVIDLLALVGYLGGLALLILLGYVFLVGDIRAYLRALRGVMIRVVTTFPTLPNWARYQTPYSFRVLGLQLPCTTADVKQAYLKMAERLHPDRGGDPQKFHELRRHFEQAMAFLETWDRA